MWLTVIKSLIKLISRMSFIGNVGDRLVGGGGGLVVPADLADDVEEV